MEERARDLHRLLSFYRFLLNNFLVHPCRGRKARGSVGLFPIIRILENFISLRSSDFSNGFSGYFVVISLKISLISKQVRYRGGFTIRSISRFWKKLFEIISLIETLEIQRSIRREQSDRPFASAPLWIRLRRSRIAEERGVKCFHIHIAP